MSRLDFAPDRENEPLVLEHFLASNADLAVTEEEARGVIHQAWSHICDVYDISESYQLAGWPPIHTWIELHCRGYDYSIYLGKEDQDWKLGSWMFKDNESSRSEGFVLLRIIMRFGDDNAVKFIQAFKDAGLPPAHVALDQVTWVFSML